ncbi:hypothetical protein MMC16_003332 [Acarospora aff. strigata]|nr:hypothetical protein [Acarospora aff. strigata]
MNRTQAQWQRKKQTKEEARNAKRAKLDPENAKSVKDVMEENALKRKREREDDPNGEDIGAEKPGEGLKATTRIQKRQKRKEDAQDKNSVVETGNINPPDSAGRKVARVVKRKEKKERKKAKDAAIKAKQQAKKVRKEEEAALVTEAEGFHHSGVDGPSLHMNEAIDIGRIEMDDIVEEKSGKQASELSSSLLSDSPTFDLSTGQSGTSSISSIVTPLPVTTSKMPLHEPTQGKADPAQLKARLQKRIDDLRAVRKADGLNGSPARNRQELMEARRRKEEQRRAHKKELRQLAKRDEESAREKALRSRNSPASGSDAVPLQDKSVEPHDNFSFGRVAFENGQQMNSTLSTVLDLRRRKGPQDPLTAIRAAERKQQRINGLDEVKRARIEDKDTWLNARKRAHGEMVRDDTSLLKKTLKRKEKAKQKSGQEWKHRLEGVEKGKAMRQKKRDENLKKRRDEKGMKGKKTKGGKGAKHVKPKFRPGFEGSFRAKVGSGLSKRS